ncbi:CotH kinase family protein [Planctomicrobium piriforme]|uniref:Spore coat protein CotH n=1 Tax=Planctomicrobium piriforme TaxID=1576369 RepID=A0A1I3C2G5_9PLAN|nr:CotH kinase family protein [Planctomicrobium piriforme]SFH68640.1 Spore coat protein CotH [Planctomicrobium piriforme]
MSSRKFAVALLLMGGASVAAFAQNQDGPPGGMFPGGFPPGPPPGGMMHQERKLVSQFDKDGDKRLNRTERDDARKFMKENPQRGPGGFGRPGFGPGGPGGPGGGMPPGGPGGGPNGGPPGGGPMGGPPGGGRGFGPPGFGPGREREPASPGPKVAVDEVQPIEAALYDPTVFRTVFLTFEDPDWETEMAEFNNTDVEIPATLVVDGKTYPQVGVHFRGMSSFMGVQAGSKRSLNVSLDFVDENQRLDGYKTLNLNNSHEDPSFLHTVLYFDIARKYIAAPKANFVRVVINGESWGVYSNVQQFDKTLVKENFRESNGARWKVPGSPGGRGGLEYLGDDPEAYKKIYDIKSKDDDAAWQALIKLCKTLNETPADKLEAALEPMLDVDGALWFLALENVLINSDGYWIRASDYSIYLDEKGKFHILPHDANETFQAAMGPGMGMGPPGMGPGGRGMGRGPGGPNGPGGPGGPGNGPPEGGPPGGGPMGFGPPPDGGPPMGPPMGPPGQGGPMGRQRGPGGMTSPGGKNGIELEPLYGLKDTSKPLRSKLLAVPALKEKYLDHVLTLTEDWLDWQKLGPVVESYVRLIDSAVEQDTKKLSSTAAFRAAVSQTSSGEANDRRMSLKSFADQRRKFLLSQPEIKKAGKAR